jgi:hypothetical protein
VIDPESESAEYRGKSLALTELLDAGHPVVDRSQVREVSAESRRLAKEARQARQRVAAQVAAGAGAPCAIGREPPVRRVRTDPRTGRDLDPLGGRSAVTDELLRYWEHQRDTVAPAVEGSYREAAERTPYRPALVASALETISRLRERREMLPHGVELEAAVARYDAAYTGLRQSLVDCQDIAGAAVTRLAALRRIEAEAEFGDRDIETDFLAAAISQAVEPGLVDAKTTMPLVPAGGRK